MKIGICNDHAGVAYKKKLMKMLRERGIEVVNFGTDTEVLSDQRSWSVFNFIKLLLINNIYLSLENENSV